MPGLFKCVTYKRDFLITEHDIFSTKPKKRKLTTSLIFVKQQFEPESRRVRRAKMADRCTKCA